MIFCQAQLQLIFLTLPLALATIEKQAGSELCQAQEILLIGLIFIFEGQTAQYSSVSVTVLQKITFNGKLL